jgi:hypothetical protein
MNMKKLFRADSIRSTVNAKPVIQAGVLAHTISTEQLADGDWIAYTYGGGTTSGATQSLALQNAIDSMLHNGWTDNYEQAAREANAKADARSKPNRPAVYIA